MNIFGVLQASLHAPEVCGVRMKCCFQKKRIMSGGLNMSKDAIPTNDNQEDCIKSPWFKSKTVVPHNLPKSIDYKFAWNETGLLEVDGEEPALEEPKE